MLLRSGFLVRERHNMPVVILDASPSAPEEFSGQAVLVLDSCFGVGVPRNIAWVLIGERPGYLLHHCWVGATPGEKAEIFRVHLAKLFTDGSSMRPATGVPKYPVLWRRHGDAELKDVCPKEIPLGLSRF